METVSKSQFAKLANVSPARVTQWIASGQIPASAIKGNGRSARIIVARAMAALRLSLDGAQRSTINATAKLSGESDEDLDRRLKRLRIAQFERRDREDEEEEALRKGRFMLASEARQAMTRQAGEILSVIESGLANMANAIASKSETPYRDVLHALQQEFRNVRQGAADALRAQAEREPAFREIDGDGAPIMAPSQSTGRLN